MPDVATIEKFEALLYRMDKEYPYRVELSMSKPFNLLVKWLMKNRIAEYDHYSCIKGKETINVICFKHDRDAMWFRLMWA